MNPPKGAARQHTDTRTSAPVRLEGRDKVTGTARYAAEYAPDGRVYAWPIPATIARGKIVAIDCGQALAEPGAIAVLTHENAPRLGETGDRTLAVLQTPGIAHRGQYVALAVAETLEAARATAAAVRVEYAPERHQVLPRPDHPDSHVLEEADDEAPEGWQRGDVEGAYAAAEIRIDAVYRIPALHNHPMEPHAATALWADGQLVVHDSSQGAGWVRQTLSELFGMDRDRITVVSEHVGGGFGSKGTTRPHAVLAAMAARHVGRPVTLALPRNQLAAVVGYRAATEQRLRIGAAADGRISALAHEVVSYHSTIGDFVEQAAKPARSMYASPHSRTSHRVGPLDVPPPSWMRAPGECSGMFALESAMDELAVACGIDPIELRIRNEPDRDPASGLPFSSRHLVECLREGARRFGWTPGPRRPGSRTEGGLLIGTGVAASTYSADVEPSEAEAHADASGNIRILLNATDIGTGARTILAQIAAEALDVPLDRVRIEIGSSDLPYAPIAGGSTGAASWGWAVHKAATALAAQLADRNIPLSEAGLRMAVNTEADVAARSAEYARRSFGAQFAEVQVDRDTGETRLRRLLGVFAAGRILNARTARSQFVGAMTMGASMALLEHSTMDPAFGDHPERDLASYHVAVSADVPDIQAYWIEEEDPHLNPLGVKGIGEIGIVGTAAAVANAVYDATGVRVRTLPVRVESLLPNLGAR
ncbi:xanthine dehydrogenase family protein molybdopterin-binding subunit [Streptomyces himalayensis]|uniref:Xanthine dehydrogenase family protein molybdopterin-binding subunit n=1 Tax=Streptomyces himalayensis subsp. himalayensis TaxID=2756131 RepID=A0A7W0I9I6_9ACTN|nr:xanthine dehydrogenase family protein molybdopterin-binding subunit [Streptomyces himalayensis]MBA2947390.1 xanthine dehydrogenase family protein molybdopterin-binding subunit [Streptomyces himalayensis subsp. himalayensis]